MVEPVDLAFFDLSEDALVQGAGRGKVSTEGLFDRYTAEAAHALVHQPETGKFLDDRPEEGRRHGEIEGGIAGLAKALADFEEDVVFGEITLQIGNPRPQALPRLILVSRFIALEMAEKSVKPLAQELIVTGLDADADNV